MEDFWAALPAELTQRIAAHLADLAPNDVPCGLRPACKHTAAALHGSGFATVCLSQPVPPDVFAAHWTRAGATDHLTLGQRKQLIRLTAASGVVPNLEVAVRVAGLRLDGWVLVAAAAAGRLCACDWLLRQGLAWSDSAMDAAAEGGHLEVCRAAADAGCRLYPSLVRAAASSGSVALVQWLLARGAGWCEWAAGRAAAGGHAGVVDVLMQVHEAHPEQFPMRLSTLLAGAAWGLPLPQFRRVAEWCQGRPPPPGNAPGAGPQQPTPVEQWQVLLCAVLSPGPEWAAKAAWLLDEQGYPASVDGAEDTWLLRFAHRAAPAPAPAVQRLAWMRGRELLKPPVADWLLRWAVARGSADVVSELLEAGAVPGTDDAAAAARGGHLAVLQAIQAHRLASMRSMLEAEGAGHLAILRALHAIKARGLGQLLTAPQQDGCCVFWAAARAGQVEVLEWLQGAAYPAGLPPPGTYPLVLSTFTAAASGGSLPAMRWLLQRGCPHALADAGGIGGAERLVGKAECVVAVGEASVEVVEFLAQHGCLDMDRPDGLPYVWAAQVGNVPVLAALRRLGCAWSPDTFAWAVRQAAQVYVLAWLLAAGCPVDQPQVEAELRGLSGKKCPHSGMDLSAQMTHPVLALMRERAEAGRAGPGAAKRALREHDALPSSCSVPVLSRVAGRLKRLLRCG